MGVRMRYLVIDSSGTVVNIVIWDGVAPYTPGDGCRLERCADHPHEVVFGWQLVDGQWHPPLAATADTNES